MYRITIWTGQYAWVLTRKTLKGTNRLIDTYTFLKFSVQAIRID